MNKYTILGIWHNRSQQWVEQRLKNDSKLTSWQLNTNYSLSEPLPVVFGSETGEIKSLDMDKLPRRIYDSHTEVILPKLFTDCRQSQITAVSAYYNSDTWGSRARDPMEVAYGTVDGRIVLLMSQPERSSQNENGVVNYGLSVMFSFSVHNKPIEKISIGSRYLVSVCSDKHVRSFLLTRFRGRLSNWAKAISSFTVKTVVGEGDYVDAGPYTLETPISESVFIQKTWNGGSEIFVRLSSNGQRVCKLRSVQSGCKITAVCVVDCMASVACGQGTQHKQLILCGYDAGHVDIFDLVPSLEVILATDKSRAIQTTNGNKNFHISNHIGDSQVFQGFGGPSHQELLRTLDTEEDLSNFGSEFSSQSSFL